MVFFIQGRKLETVVQDPGGDTLFCPQGTTPGGYIATPQSPPDTKGHERGRTEPAFLLVLHPHLETL